MADWKIRQRQIIGDRCGGQCEFEAAMYGVTPGETHAGRERIIEWIGPIAWARCSATQGLVPAHVYRRWKNGILATAEGCPLFLHPDAVIAGCPACHRAFDVDDRGAQTIVRAPVDRVDAARVIILATLAAHRENGKAAISVDLTSL